MRFPGQGISQVAVSMLLHLLAWGKPLMAYSKLIEKKVPSSPMSIIAL